MTSGRVNTEEAFWRGLSKPQGNDGCWFWMGAVNKKGYGTTCFRTKQWYAHRLAYWFFNGNIPDSNGKNRAILLHSCDESRCCNPKHLSVGTISENNKDMWKRGRGWSPFFGLRGSKCPFAKLTDGKVRTIRKLLTRGLSVKALSERYGVTTASIWNIINGHTWRHVK